MKKYEWTCRDLKVKNYPQKLAHYLAAVNVEQRWVADMFQKPLWEIGWTVPENLHEDLEFKKVCLWMAGNSIGQT